MKKTLLILGIIMLSQLIFVAMVHVLVWVQGKDSPETQAALNGMPVIGGFFAPPSVDPDHLTGEQARDLMAVRRLRESLELYDLPRGFSREEMEKLTHELADARTESEQLRLELERKAEELEADRREVAAERERLTEMANSLGKEAESLQARRAELAQRENLLEGEEEENLKVIRATYEKMEPVAAQKILDGMDVDLVAKILAGMSERNSARILQAFGDDVAGPDGPRGGKAKAVEITKRMMALTAGAADKGQGPGAGG